jgi:Uncharacterised nucleotidyltransferase
VVQLATTSPSRFLSTASPEAHLMLACARTTLDPVAVEKIIALLQRQIDWDYMLRKAREHFITPLVCRSLTTCSEAVPPEILQRLDRDLSAHTRRNLFLTRELLKLLSLMQENDIRAVAYKGPVLAASAYGNVGLRSFIDLDILVHERDILRAKELLISRGFQTLNQLTKAQEEAHLRSRDEKDIVLVRPDLPVSVELHWRIASLFLFPLDSDQLWQRLGTMKLGGANVSNLRAEDMLLILCVHGAKHSFKRLQWICDIAELIRANPRLDWNQVLQEAANSRSMRMLSLGLLLAADLLGATIPNEVSLVIGSDGKAKSLASRVLKSLFREPANLSHVFTDSTFLINLKEEWADRTLLRTRHYLNSLNKAVTPNVQDKDLLRLPAFLSAFYYLLRPIRLANTYGLELLMQTIRQRKR